jgi:hypothetical protein
MVDGGVVALVFLAVIVALRVTFVVCRAIANNETHLVPLQVVCCITLNFNYKMSTAAVFLDIEKALTF